MEEEAKRKAKKSKKDKKKKDKQSRKSRENSHQSDSLVEPIATSDEPEQQTAIANGHSSTKASRDSGTLQPDHWHPALSKSKHKKMNNLVRKHGMDN
jgi:hypothetical protein